MQTKDTRNDILIPIYPQSPSAGDQRCFVVLRKTSLDRPLSAGQTNYFVVAVKSHWSESDISRILSLLKR